MKKTFIKNSLIAILIVVIVAIAFVGCGVVENSTHTHQYSEEITKAPSCTEEGVKTFTCSCDDSYIESIAKLGCITVGRKKAIYICTAALPPVELEVEC